MHPGFGQDMPVYNITITLHYIIVQTDSQCRVAVVLVVPVETSSASSTYCIVPVVSVV